MIFVGNYHFPQTACDLGIPERFLHVKIPDELPVYTPGARIAYNVKVFDNYIHVFNSIQTVAPIVDLVTRTRATDATDASDTTGATATNATDTIDATDAEVIEERSITVLKN